MKIKILNKILIESVRYSDKEKGFTIHFKRDGRWRNSLIYKSGKVNKLLCWGKDFNSNN